MEKKDKIIFWTRFGLFTLFGCLLPFVFIAWRYSLFSKVDRVSLSGWGIVALIIVFCFLKYIVYVFKQGVPYSLPIQIVSGYLKVILPLLVMLLLTKAIKNNVDLFIQALTWVIVCEGIAIPVNPLPKWLKDNNIQKQDDLIERFWKKKKESGN